MATRSLKPTALGYSDITIALKFHPSETGKHYSILSDLPLGLDPNGLGMKREFYYFEVTVEELSYAPQTTIISLVSFGRWDCFVNDSYGGRTFGSPYTKGSVVGVGYVFETGAVFFTLNGMLIGEAMTIEERVKHPYHAAVAADGPAMLSLNFGQSPFLYAIAKSSGSLDGMNFLVPSLGLY